MNQKDKVIEALKGMVLTIGIAVLFYYLMKYIGLKFNLIDMSEATFEELGPYREAVFFYLPQFEWIQYLENKLLIILMVYGAPTILGVVFVLGIGFLVSGPSADIDKLADDAYERKQEQEYQEQMYRTYHSHDHYY